MKLLHSFICLLFASVSLMAQYDAPLEVGSMAPLFEGLDSDGETIALQTLLEQDKEVVLVFYRGNWCPYCKRHLSSLQDSLQMIVDSGAEVVVVTPEKEKSVEKTERKTDATFPIISDSDYSIMEAYGVAYSLDKETVPRFYNLVLGMSRRANGNKDDVLPVPATYIIGSDGNIRYVHFDTDYRQRSNISEILKQLN